MKKLQGNFIRKLNRAEKEPSFPDPGERTGELLRGADFARVPGECYFVNDPEDSPPCYDSLMRNFTVLFILWLANCYFACGRACSIIAFCPRV